MLSFVLKHTPLKMCWVPGYSDYYPEAPGGRPGGRSIEPKPFNARKLGADMAGLEPAYGKVPLNVVVMQQDYVRLNQLKRHPRGVLRSMKVGARTMWAKATGKNLVGMGRALIGPLRIGLQRAGVPVELNTAFTDLFVENGVVSGVYVRDSHEAESAEPQLIRARRGVILACGGFEHNEQMRIKYQRAPITTEWTVGASANTGDGILAAEKLGAALDLMDDAWWGPTVPLVGKPWFALGAQLSRFDHRQHVRQAIHERIDAIRRSLSSYVRRRTRPGARTGREHSGVAGVRPAIPGPLHLRGTTTRATHSEQLAGFRRHRPGRYPCGAGRQGRSTRGRTHCHRPAFQRIRPVRCRRGLPPRESAYDRYYGDPSNKPNPNLGEVGHPPYYGAKMVPGDLGTKGGIRTDVNGRALRDDGSIIDGLYAAGNVSAPVMGHTYPGPGGTIGPAMTFGYLAALHIADQAGKR